MFPKFDISQLTSESLDENFRLCLMLLYTRRKKAKYNAGSNIFYTEDSTEAFSRLFLKAEKLL